MYTYGYYFNIVMVQVNAQFGTKCTMKNRNDNMEYVHVEYSNPFRNTIVHFNKYN